MTIDVEDWFHVSRFRKKIKVSEWPDLESRVSQNVSRILKFLQEYNVKATFFVLAWVAERYPEMVQAILEYGHEIGTHGYGHQLIYEQTQAEFEEDLQKSVEILEKAQKAELTSGRGPTGIAAAALYVAALMHGEKRTQREVADVAGVTEVTIRNRYKEIIDHLGIKDEVEEKVREEETEKENKKNN